MYFYNLFSLHHLSSTSCYAPPPFADHDMTAAANVVPQTLPTSLEFPPLFDIADMRPFNGNIDHHSSDYIFDSFNATYRFLLF
jgi:hypothetical protein